MAHVTVELPYGHDTIAVHVPGEKLIGIFLPRSLPPVSDPAKAVRDALAHPVSGPRLRDRATAARHVAIVIEDATRSVPNALLIDAVMAELTAGGISPHQVAVIVATGLHRPMTEDELAGALGHWFGVVGCENHDANDPRRLTGLGTTSLGTAISLNRSFMQADLRITTGDVEYHQFCGYGGGVKCVYPGLADAAAIAMNHSRMDLPGTGPGLIDGNPVRDEIEEVGRMARVDVNVSVAMDTEHRIVGVRAGDPTLSFREACRWIDEMYAIDVPRRAHLVIASPGGHPKDIDLYQSQKAIEGATQVVRPGGGVLLAARCSEGSGSDRFEAWMAEAYSADDIIRRIRDTFVMGGHKAYHIAREVKRARVHLYSEIPPGRVRSYLMTPLRSVADMDRLIAQAESVMVLPQATLIRARVSPPGDLPNAGLARDPGVFDACIPDIPPLPTFGVGPAPLKGKGGSGPTPSVEIHASCGAFTIKASREPRSGRGGGDLPVKDEKRKVPTMPQSTIRFGLVGYGAWGQHHAASIAKADGARLVAIAEPSEASRKEARNAHPDAIVLGDYRELVQRDDLDVVDVIVPNRLHHEVARSVLSSGKHLLLEKPMCLTIPECDDLIRLAEEKNLRIAINHEFRLSSLWGTVKELVEDGLVGRPQYVLVELSRNPYRLGSDGWRFDIDRVGDWILEEPIHFFDLARWYLSSVGEPVSVYAAANSRQPGHPELQDNCSAIITFTGGAYAVVSQTLAAFEHHQTVKLTGTKGAIWASWSGAMDRTRQPTFFLKAFDGTEVEELPITGTPGELFELEEQIAATVAAIRDGRPTPCTGNDGKWSVAMCLATQRSVRTGQPVVL